MESAFDWKQYYRAERATLGAQALDALLDAADQLEFPAGGALVVPHTRLEITGAQIATAVRAVVASGVERVLALGVLHGGRRSDHPRVAAARAGEAEAVAEPRGVHHEDGMAAEEFSLDAFVELLDRGAARAGRSIEVTRRYPFLVGDDPETLPGIEELERLVGDGAALVATTDPIHHGHAYGTPPKACADPSIPSTQQAAREAIDEQLAALSDHRFGDFLRLAERDRSDFRDTGPVVAHLVGAGFVASMHELALVDYSSALDAPSPSWVAGALVTLCPPVRVSVDEA